MARLFRQRAGNGGAVRLRDKTAIITGGLGGQGREEVRLFLLEGANVVCLDTVEPAGDDPAGAAADPARLLMMTADVSDNGAWAEVVGATIQRFGRVDVLVNNAGISSSSFADEFDRHGWEQIIDVNLKGAFLGITAVLPYMVGQAAGSIVNISSVGALAGLPFGHLAYSASKGGLAALSRTVAVRYGPQGVRCNTIYPGVMSAMRTSKSTANARGNRDRTLAATPLRRAGSPGEVAQAVVFLASDEASYITGADLAIDGGFLAG
jgi:NAD(P)-dependent dehydrogenase (short-subunit alcohol dehydrogenase family)